MGWESGRSYRLFEDKGAWDDDVGVYDQDYTERETPVFGMLQMLKPYQIDRLPEGVKIQQARYRFYTRERLNFFGMASTNDGKRSDRIQYGGPSGNSITLQVVGLKPAVPPWEVGDAADFADSAIYFEYYLADVGSF